MYSTSCARLAFTTSSGVPGTNEIPIIDGTEYPENNVLAAMGAARMTGKPGVLVVHVTPGIAHSIGNLFNAWRSRMPLVILCCQQQNELVTQEPLLASNLVDLARQYTKWAHEVRAAEELPLVLQRAFKEAMAPPAGPVFVAIPWEFTIREIGADDRIQGVTHVAPRFTGDPSAIQQAASLLAQANNQLIIAGDAVGYATPGRKCSNSPKCLALRCYSRPSAAWRISRTMISIGKASFPAFRRWCKRCFTNTMWHFYAASARRRRLRYSNIPMAR
jgi:thiamine pyrophosphate-dependent acetolactate synthase large subunit-like protein